MGEELTRSLTTLAERGIPRGSSEVLERARHDAAPQSRPWRRGMAVAVVAAAAVLIVIGASVLLLRPFDEEPTPVVTVPPEPDSTTRLPAITLEPATDVEPVRVSTVLGDLEFTTLQFPPDSQLISWVLNPSSLVATPFGLVGIDDDALRWSTDGLAWKGAPVDDEPQWLTVVGSDVVVLGSADTVRYGWDGSTWTELARLDVPGQVRQIAFGPRGAVAVRGNTIYYSPDGEHFTEADRGPNTDRFVTPAWVSEEDRDFGDCRATFGATVGWIRTVLPTDAGFVAFTSADHPDGVICAPLLWFSEDGSTWDLVSPDSPFGTMSVFDMGGQWRISERDGRFVTTGRSGGQGQSEEQPALWVSDDGLAWQRTDLDVDDVFAIAGGDLGWVILTGDDMWFSADGLTWDGPHFLPDGLGTGWFVPQAAVGSDMIFGVGTVPGTWDFTPVVARLQD